MTSAWLLWLIVVASYDFYRRRVPNWLALLGAAAGVTSLALAEQPFSINWSEAALGAAVGFGFLLVFYASGVMSAGDVKFGGALGLWIGLQPLLPIWLGASMLAAVHAVLWLVLQRWPFSPQLVRALSGVLTASHDIAAVPKRQRHIPFAAYLAIAAMGWWLWRNALR